MSSGVVNKSTSELWKELFKEWYNNKKKQSEKTPKQKEEIENTYNDGFTNNTQIIEQVSNDDGDESHDQAKLVEAATPIDETQSIIVAKTRIQYTIEFLDKEIEKIYSINGSLKSMQNNIDNNSNTELYNKINEYDNELQNINSMKNRAEKVVVPDDSINKDSLVETKARVIQAYENLYNEMTKINKEYNKLKDEHTILEQEIANFDKSVKQLNTKIPNIQKEIKDIKSQVNNEKNPDYKIPDKIKEIIDKNTNKKKYIAPIIIIDDINQL
jgi:prefoldin subunit 5